MRALCILVLLLFPAGCASGASGDAKASADPVRPLVELPLSGPAASPGSQISAMDWLGEELVLVPQYPARVGEGMGVLYALSREDVARAAAGSDEPLVPRTIDLAVPDLSRLIPGYQGFEAAAFDGREAFFSIEAEEGGVMHAWLVRGELDEAGQTLTLDTASLTRLDTPVNLANMSYEALVLKGPRILALFEANGENVNPAPKAPVVDHAFNSNGFFFFPHLEYRVTDATRIGDDGLFWVVNCFWPGERRLLDPAPDPVAARWGGPAGAEGQVERLIALRLGRQGVEMAADVAPVFFELADEARNWEGVARLGGAGFLLVTDSHPGTLLAFVPR